MKTILSLSILFYFCTIALPSLGALTDADLDKIRLIVKEEVTAETAKIKEEVTAETAKINDKIDKLDARLRTVETDMTVTQTEITNLKGIFNNGFDDVQKNFDRQNNIIIACIGIPLAILAIGATVWGILAHRRSGKDRALEKQIETLTQEIETLKQRRVVSP